METLHTVPTAAQAARAGLPDGSHGSRSPRPVRLVVLGRQGSGKGTQCGRLAGLLGVVHVSTGDLFRDAVRAGTPLGGRVKAVLDAGELVPDGVVVEVIAERLGREDARRRGVVLDGFPRTVGQAALVADLLGPAGIDLAVNLDVPVDEVLHRLLLRRVCSECGHGVSTAHPTSCDRCGGELVRRGDDTERAIRRRLEIFEQQAGPLLAWYRARGRLAVVDGTGTPDEVFGRLVGVVRARAVRAADCEELVTAR